MVKDELSNILEEIGKKRPDLRIPHLEKIHPIYEALTALLRQHLPDDSIVRRYAKNEQSLRAIIATDVLLDYLGKKNSDNITKVLASGAPLNEIVERISLEIAEGKRVQEGKILVKITAEVEKDPYLEKKLKDINQSGIYIEKDKIPQFKEDVEKIKKIKKIKKFVYLVISCAALTIGFYNFNNLKTKINEYYTPKDYISLQTTVETQDELVAKLKKDYSNLEETLNKEKQAKPSCETRVPTNPYIINKLKAALTCYKTNNKKKCVSLGY